MKKVVFALMLAAAINAAPATASASDAGCFEELANCMQRAATRDSWFSRWLAGLDCELDFVECAREKLVGG